MSPSSLPPDATQPLPPAQQPQPATHLTLQEALGRLHMDVLKELERFRVWQRLQRLDSVPPPRVSQLRNSSPVQRSAPVLIQEVVEDLEDETPPPSGGGSPLLILLLWVLSCAGIGFGVRWLIWPQELSLPQKATHSITHSTEKERPIQVNLAQLPLIPLEPLAVQVGDEFYSGDLDPDRLVLGLTPTPALEDLHIPPLEGTPNLLDSLQVELAAAEEESPSSLPVQTVEQLAASLERSSPSSQPAVAAIPPQSDINSDTNSDLDLGPNRGEGTFLVLTTYSGEESLARARQVADGAFVKNLNGQKFVQVAAFEQLEYARYHAETLKSQGFNVTIVEQ